MPDVIRVPQWWNRKPDNESILEKFVSCDRFIRARIIPPPVGSIVFNFHGGVVTLTGGITTVTGGDCEIRIYKGVVNLRGSVECAEGMYSSIRDEIKHLNKVKNENDD